ncbi:MAG: exo-alpha-sialidase [Armatimonadetes bacterium]|nr:exo-alpha-sialidase [Armatimonadota bacterium]
MNVEILDYTERTIYHSPETPGWTSWVGLWQTRDGALQCSFNQQTGPRDHPVGSTPVLESRDGGVTWTRVPGDVPVGGGRGMAILRDGTLVRGRWAGDPNDCGWVERSTDGGRSWGPRIDFVSAQEYRAWPTILRPLRDGRIVLMAGVWKRGDGDPPNPRMTKMLFVSPDGGLTWDHGLELMPTEQGVCEESDWCELPSGDLFFVHRVEHFPAQRTEIPPGAARMGEPFPNGYSDRMQSVVYRWREGFKPGPAVPAPFPHSGFPEVMLTADDLILHFATDGIYWTDDIGGHWTRLPVRGTGYYPRAVQLANGTIVVIGHVGSDDVYGTVDQSIWEQTFRLKVTR